MAYKYTQIVVLLVLLIYCKPHHAQGLSSEARTTIEKGLEAGKVIAETLKDGDFRDSLVKLGKNLTPFLGALGPLVGITLAFIPSPDSAELAYMKKKFAEVNNKLDILTNEFDEVKGLIDWSAVTVSYGTYERKIRNAENNLNRMHKADPAHSQGPKDDFLNSYNYDFDGSLQKLYDACMENDHIFSKNILQSVVKYTKNTRRKYETFSQGLLQLLVQGIKVKVSAYHVKQYSAQTITALENEWQAKIQKLTTRMADIDDQITADYHQQLGIDIDDIILRHNKVDNKALMNTLYNFVVDKYDWRFWFVAVYDDVVGFDKHTISQCGGYSRLHKHGKNIIVASQDKSRRTKKSSHTKLENTLQSVVNDIASCQLANPKDRARALVDHMGAKLGKSCDAAALRMAVVPAKGLWFISIEQRRAFRNVDTHKNCCYGSGWDRNCRTVTWKYNMLVFA